MLAFKVQTTPGKGSVRKSNWVIRRQKISNIIISGLDKKMRTFSLIIVHIHSIWYLICSWQCHAAPKIFQMGIPVYGQSPMGIYTQIFYTFLWIFVCHKMSFQSLHLHNWAIVMSNDQTHWMALKLRQYILVFVCTRCNFFCLILILFVLSEKHYHIFLCFDINLKCIS